LLKIVGFLLRLFSYLFHLVLGFFLLAIAIVAGFSHQPLNMGMLPFSDDNVLRGVFLLALAAITTTLLAIARVVKFLFPLWAAVALYLLVRGFLFSPYWFPDTDSFKTALLLIGGAFLALIGALWTLKPRRGRLYS
jgi:hypothetical protein